ncbi:hypothetical protein BST91_11250 [Nonlabens tegetincola]|uniref:hypothetical protein n=1 Tax=Nonlabens tegetincola TaxID=323273 RepID=UPI000A20200B|nr:hypothetical protein [Nonlabens tegetincola]ARN72193.1 hypothetical protein BST91_11250 [Nonlabens tegetincola]
MTNFQIIQKKLTQFISKYYRNELIRGVILFAALSLLYFLFTVVIEHFLWLSTVGRTVLFILFVIVQSFLLFKFVGIPLARLFKLFKGIDFRDASTIIGTHFPEVSDKLVNVLQLHKNGGDDELTWASINQKSEELKPIPFSLAIDYKKNSKYLKYLAIPLVIIVGLFFTGNDEVITKSASRVADFNNEYIPPAPYSFKLLNDDLSTLQNQDYKINVQVVGKKLPESVSINYKGQNYFMNQDKNGNYSYVFKRPSSDIDFFFNANEVASPSYQLKVGAVPSIDQFNMVCRFPSHIGRTSETIKGTGNALLPEGTRVQWILNTSNTQVVDFVNGDDTYSFKKQDNQFAFAKAISQPTSYAISTSNSNTKNYETLNFKIDVVKDEYPELKVEEKVDSLNDQIRYYKGQVVDDYGIKKIVLNYYIQDDAATVKKLVISKDRGSYETFLYTFPQGLELLEGKRYEYYFEAFDNDVVNNFKSVKSQVYGYRKITSNEQEQRELQEQKESLESIEKSLMDQEKQQDKLKDLSREAIEKKDLDFNDRKKLEQVLDKQQKQEQLMNRQLDRLKNNLEKSIREESEEKEALKERMEQSADQIKKNEELLKKIQEYKDKMPPAELKEQLDKAQRNSKQQQRSLEQLLELTKRFYVKEKFKQLAKDLSQIALKQKKAADVESSEEQQDSLNKEFQEWRKELEELENENTNLKRPHKLEFDPPQADDIEQDQNDAKENIESKESQKASSKQRSAADKMKRLSQQMGNQMRSMEKDQMMEDAETLRQILDNLIGYSLEQEALMDEVSLINRNSPSFGKKLIKQKKLEYTFEHVDDSLFALSSRNPKVGEEINSVITYIHYGIDTSMEQLAEFKIERSLMAQQEAFSGANKLSAMLSDAMDNMNASGSSGPGQPSPGEGGAGFQLQDIIKQQESLSKKGKGDKSGQQGQQGRQGQQGQQGQSGQSGNGGKNGQSGQSGQSGSGGEQGQNGQSGNGGEDGQSGESGGTGGSSGNGSGGSSGQSGRDSNTGESGYRESESEAERIYDIYKKQKELRDQLENMIENSGIKSKVESITDNMKAVERKLLDQGFDREVEDLMLRIQHDLLKLNDAGLLQAKQEERKSTTNRNSFNNETNNKLPDASNYFNNKEILNRQVLPLQPLFKNRVKEYFKND